MVSLDDKAISHSLRVVRVVKIREDHGMWQRQSSNRLLWSLCHNNPHVDGMCARAAQMLKVWQKTLSATLRGSSKERSWIRVTSVVTFLKKTISSRAKSRAQNSHLTRILNGAVFNLESSSSVHRGENMKRNDHRDEVFRATSRSGSKRTRRWPKEKDSHENLVWKARHRPKGVPSSKESTYWQHEEGDLVVDTGLRLSDRRVKGCVSSIESDVDVEELNVLH
ncbi:hypothetical protein BU15DRAFT_62362 [Melanogaster broomeanus]|nr:hypothetical protein BU15DRAFT_62362 [Melanogaster broomeanus]